jgi:hypothetical protein
MFLSRDLTASCCAWLASSCCCWWYYWQKVERLWTLCASCHPLGWIEWPKYLLVPIYQTTWHHISEDHSVKCYVWLCLWTFCLKWMSICTIIYTLYRNTIWKEFHVLIHKHKIK